MASVARVEVSRVRGTRSRGCILVRLPRTSLVQMVARVFIFYNIYWILIFPKANFYDQTVTVTSPNHWESICSDVHHCSLQVMSLLYARGCAFRSLASFEFSFETIPSRTVARGGRQVDGESRSFFLFVSFPFVPFAMRP